MRTSLRAELHYREHLLNRKEAKNLLGMEWKTDPEAPPSLVIVLDVTARGFVARRGKEFQLQVATTMGHGR